MLVSAGGGGGCSATSSVPFHLLELTVISAQDLHRRLGRRVRAYAVAWADHGRNKLCSDVDRTGGPDPTWNDRFMFRVDPEFLQSETAGITVEVRGSPRLMGGDAVLGSTRIVVSTFVRPSSPGMFSPSSSLAHSATGRQVAALLLRRPRTLRPQGILNVAVTLLDATQARTIASICNAPGSRDAFAVKDLADLRQASLCRITEEEQPDAGVERRQRAVEHSGPLDPKGAAVEQKKLEMTLKKWREDLSPDETSRGGRKRRRRRGSCFGSADWAR